MSVPLDQERPLWQIYLIENLADNRFAAISKTHHALVDGIAAIDVGAVILDPDPEGTDLGLPEQPWEPSTSRSDQLILSRVIQARERLFGLSRDTAARLTPTGAAATTMEAGRTVQGFLELARNSDPVKPTFINQEIGRDRRVAFARTSLEEMKAAGEPLRRDRQRRPALGLDRRAAALVRRARRARAERVRGAGPDEHPQARGEGRPGQPDDDAARAAAARRARSAAAAGNPQRDDGEAEELGGSPRRLADHRGLGLGAADRQPPARPDEHRPLPRQPVMPQRLPWNLVISNVPGPPMAVYLLGRRLQAIHPFVALSPQKRALSIGVISYDGEMMFGLVGDRDRLPDLDLLSGFIDDSLTEQFAAR